MSCEKLNLNWEGGVGFLNCAAEVGGYDGRDERGRGGVQTTEKRDEAGKIEMN